MNKALRNAFLLAVFSTLPAICGPTELPAALLGTHNVGNFTFPYLEGNPFPGGYGGSFRMDVYPTTGSTANPFNATIWCVDYQLDVDSSSAYTADIVRLSDVTADENEVRYGTVDSQSSSTQPHWVNDLGAGYDSAESRYTLAAALISQYQPAADTPANDARDQAIQGAIWYVTMNSEYNASATWPGFDITTGAPAGGNWVTWAEANVSSVNRSQWAIVSGAADPLTGLLLPPMNNGFQTFMTEVTPEPQFFGLLGLGLTALLVRARRRKQ